MANSLLHLCLTWSYQAKPEHLRSRNRVSNDGACCIDAPYASKSFTTIPLQRQPLYVGNNDIIFRGFLAYELSLMSTFLLPIAWRYEAAATTSWRPGCQDRRTSATASPLPPLCMHKNFLKYPWLCFTQSARAQTAVVGCGSFARGPFPASSCATRDLGITLLSSTIRSFLRCFFRFQLFVKSTGGCRPGRLHGRDGNTACLQSGAVAQGREL